MPNLNQESKLITPNGALFFGFVVIVFLIWYFDVDVWDHLQGLKETVHYVTGGIL